MKVTKKLEIVLHTTNAQELVNANIPFVKGVVYKTDLPEAKFVTPVSTFNGWCCDCWPLVKSKDGFAKKIQSPIAVVPSNLGEIVGSLTDLEGASR